MDNVTISLIPAVGMIVVAGAAVLYWRRVSGLQFRWFWVGAGLWTVAVIVKMLVAVLTNAAVIGLMKKSLPYPLLVLGGGLYVGIQSSLCEIGLTLLAVFLWRQLGRDAGRAIGIGVGAGAFEALLLGIMSFVTMLIVIAGLPGTEKVREEIDKLAAVTPLFWLVAPAERVIAILCHASSRALVLLGATYRKPRMVFGGFLIFTLVDGIAGAVHVSGKLGKMSMWWIELALLPFALISIPILRWCYRRWGPPPENVGSPPEARSDTPADADQPDYGASTWGREPMNWTIVNSTEDLKRFDEAVCWEDSATIEYYATTRNEDFFPSDVSRSGYLNMNIYVLCRADSRLGPYLEMVFIDCDWYSSRFLDSPYMSGRVDRLKRVEIEDAKGSTVMRCSRLIYRFLGEGCVGEGQYYRTTNGGEPSAPAAGSPPLSPDVRGAQKTTVEWPYNLPLWRRSFRAASPDGCCVAQIDPAYEVSMGNPTSGTLCLSMGLHIERCNPSFLWSQDSRYLVVPQFFHRFGLRRQRLLIVALREQQVLASTESASYFQPESFTESQLVVVKNPFRSPRRLQFTIPGDFGSRFKPAPAAWPEGTT